MNIPTLKLSIMGAIGVVGGTLTSFLGGWSNDLITLLIFMAIDLITGIIVAGVFHASKKTTGGAIESNAMFKGICKKLFMILFVAMMYRIDLMFDISYIRTAAIIGFIANEFISIVENAGLMGMPLPSVITKALELLKSKASEDGE